MRQRMARWASSVAVAISLFLVPGIAPVRPALALTCGVDVTCYTLTVVLSPLNGSGSWKSVKSDFVTPDGLIDCEFLNGSVVAGSTCSHKYKDLFLTGVEVSFAVIPATGSSACLDKTCGFPAVSGSETLFADTTDDREGLLLDKETVSVTRTGEGTGTVTSNPAGIACGATCSAGFDYGKALTLTATPDAGAVFKAWTGACAGQGKKCSLTPTPATSTNAVFGLQIATPAPAASPHATPTPTQTPTPSSSSSKSPVPKSSQANQPSPAVEGTATPATSDGSELLVSAPPNASGQPGVPTVSTSAPLDLTPIALAILGAGLLIAIGIAVGAFALRRKARSG